MICVPGNDSVAIPLGLVMLSVATGVALRRHTTVLENEKEFSNRKYF